MEDLEKIVSVLEVENSKVAASDPIVKLSLSIVKNFLKTHPVLCYGGTAINNLLPEKDRFYNPEVDIPDYDFFSRTPQEHAMILANQLSDRGVKNVEVKPGVHLGTFKVFADFEGVADITHLDAPIFDRLWKEGVVREEIHYVTPNFLRMSMYLELSRPRGDVSRWVKVYKRLELLNKHYPMVCPGVAEKPTVLDAARQKKVESMLKKYPVVLLGITASQVHLRRKNAWQTPVTLLAEEEYADKIATREKVETHEGSEILPEYRDILDEDGKTLVRIHTTSACHSYHKVGDIRVASIPTVLQFFFSYMYSGAPETEITHLLCIAQRLVDVASSKPKRRFAILTPIDCIGHQENLVEMRKTKSALYEKLSTRKSSPDFLKYFFTYNPKVTKTQRQKIRDQLRKTRKVRYESSY
jgi:hypothetical protein